MTQRVCACVRVSHVHVFANMCVGDGQKWAHTGKMEGGGNGQMCEFEGRLVVGRIDASVSAIVCECQSPLILLASSRGWGETATWQLRGRYPRGIQWYVEGVGSNLGQMRVKMHEEGDRGAGRRRRKLLLLPFHRKPMDPKFRRSFGHAKKSP